MSKFSGRRAWPLVVTIFAAPSTPLPAQQPPIPVERDHALAWGAHHLCAGVFVVGREYERAPDVVVAEDIARCPWFRWEDSFT